MQRRKGRYYLGRVVKDGQLTQEKLLDGIRHPVVFEKGKYKWTIVGCEEGDVNGSPYGDILICAASGSKEHAGKVAYIRNAPDDTYIGGFMMVLRTATGVNPEYVATYMQSSIFRGLIFRHLGGTNINNVSLELLNKLPLILPDSSAQKRIADKASSIRIEARKMKADATAALDAVKRKIEVKIIG